MAAYCPKCKNTNIKIKTIDKYMTFEVLQMDCPKCGHEKIKYVFKDKGK